MKSVYLGIAVLCLAGNLYSQDAVPAETPKPAEQPKPKTIELKEVYEDQETGQIFSKPGDNRVKLNIAPPKQTTTLPDGFAHRPDDVSKEKFTVTGRMQFRGVTGSAESLYSNGSRDYNAVDWNFRRLRLGAMYENDWWGANIQIRMENMLNRQNVVPVTSTFSFTDGNGRTQNLTYVSNTRMTDNRGYVHEAFLYAKSHFAGLRFTAGMINTQFNREYLQSSANLVTLERSFITNMLPQFDNGIMISANPLKEINPKWERKLFVSLMVGNGKGGAGDYGTGRRFDLTTSNRWGAVNLSPTYYGRMVYNVFGGLKRDADGKEVNWQEGEEIFQKDMKLSLGTAMVQTQNYVPNTLYVPEYTPGTTQAVQIAVGQGSNPDRGTIDSATGFGNFNVQNNVTTPGRPKFGMVGHTWDGTFTWKGIYLSGAYSKFRGAASNNTWGWHTTVGYNIPVGKYYIMPVLKYEHLQGDWNRNGKIDPTDSLTVYWAGLNLFGDKHHFKAQLYYQVLGNKFTVDPNTGNAMAIDD
ncbi:MAG TPA: hypothetical protein PKK94_17195, partial [Leptospiraceae bacterium]|nr:hypothetical protein [Leptospiraceae bacterium]